MEDPVSTRVAIYVDAASVLLAVPLEPARRIATIATMERLAAFAADVAAFPLAVDVEIAGEFRP